MISPGLKKTSFPFFTERHARDVFYFLCDQLNLDPKLLPEGIRESNKRLTASDMLRLMDRIGIRATVNFEMDAEAIKSYIQEHYKKKPRKNKRDTIPHIPLITVEQLDTFTINTHE